MQLRRLLIAALPLCAGVRVESESKDLVDGQSTQHVMLVDSERLRMDMNRAGSSTSVLFLTDGGNRLVMLDRDKKQYRVLDEPTAKQMSAQMQSSMAMMQEKMKDIPPEQRAMMEKMMKGRMGAMPAAAARSPIAYTAKGSSTANGFACTMYDGTRDGQKATELCAALPGQLKLSPADMGVLDKLREFTKTLVGPFANMAGVTEITDAGVQGFPVTQTTFRDGKPVTRHDVKVMQRASFTDADFSLGGATKVELMPGRGRP
jgi:hypothetical protein